MTLSNYQCYYMSFHNRRRRPIRQTWGKKSPLSPNISWGRGSRQAWADASGQAMGEIQYHSQGSRTKARNMGSKRKQEPKYNIKKGITMMKIIDIKVGDLGDIKTLAKSIQEIGLLHPIVVNQYNELVAGQRKIRSRQAK